MFKEARYRVFALRGQLIHGSSTAGSKLNRAAVTDSLLFLQQFVPVALTLVLVNGPNHQWAPVCFPPVDPADKSSLGSTRR